MFKKNLILTLAIILILPAWAMAATTVGVKQSGNQPPSSPRLVLMQGYTSTGNGVLGVGMEYNLNQRASTHDWEIDITGSPSNVELILQGSKDCNNYYDIDTYTGTTDRLRFVRNKSVKCIRGKLVTLDSGSVTITSIHGGE